MKIDKIHTLGAAFIAAEKSAQVLSSFTNNAVFAIDTKFNTIADSINKSVISKVSSTIDALQRTVPFSIAEYSVEKSQLANMAVVKDSPFKDLISSTTKGTGLLSNIPDYGIVCPTNPHIVASLTSHVDINKEVYCGIENSCLAIASSTNAMIDKTFGSLGLAMNATLEKSNIFSNTHLYSSSINHGVFPEMVKPYSVVNGAVTFDKIASSGAVAFGAFDSNHLTINAADSNVIGLSEIAANSFHIATLDRAASSVFCDPLKSSLGLADATLALAAGSFESKNVFTIGNGWNNHGLVSDSSIVNDDRGLRTVLNKFVTIDSVSAYIRTDASYQEGMEFTMEKEIKENDTHYHFHLHVHVSGNYTGDVHSDIAFVGEYNKANYQIIKK